MSQFSNSFAVSDEMQVLTLHVRYGIGTVGIRQTTAVPSVPGHGLGGCTSPVPAGPGFLGVTEQRHR